MQIHQQCIKKMILLNKKKQTNQTNLLARGHNYYWHVYYIELELEGLFRS